MTDQSNGSGQGGSEAAQAQTAAQSQAAEQQANLPQFYGSPKALRAAEHGGKGLKAPFDYRFAAGAHAVVLQAQEFRLAAASYPIVFAADDPPMPLAILGFREGQNLFVDTDGAWASGAYIPAYVRRYPFATGPGAEAGQQIVYLDEGSDLVVDLDGNPDAEALFANGEPSEKAQKMTRFCAVFDEQTQRTVAYVEELKKRDLLVTKELQFALPSGETQTLAGLRLIDELKVSDLSDDTFLEWRRQGWISLMHWHWMSMDNFQRMAQKG